MRTWLRVLGVVLLLPVLMFLVGCTSAKTPPEVQVGRTYVQEANDASAATLELAVGKVLTAYETAEKQLADKALEQDLAGLLVRIKADPANATPEKILEAQKLYLADRDKRLAAVYGETTQVKRIIEIAQADRELAKQIQAVLNMYQDAGIDMSAAKVAVQNIVMLMQAKRK